MKRIEPRTLPGFMELLLPNSVFAVIRLRAMSHFTLARMDFVFVAAKKLVRIYIAKAVAMRTIMRLHAANAVRISLKILIPYITMKGLKFMSALIAVTDIMLTAKSVERITPRNM